VAYTTGAGAVELLDMFRVAARFKVPVFVHVRSGVEGLTEVIGYAAISGAPLHVVHVNSSGARRNTPHFLRIIEEARKRGLDVTTECYPYTAGATRIESAILADGWQERLGISYGDIRWIPTGERLTAESFARYRKEGGRIILFTNTEEMVRRAVLSPLTMIASDGGLTNGQGHPRSTGAYSRVLAQYVRQEKALDWMTAMEKMSLLPARRLESFIPGMKNKGRIKPGADADLVILDPETVADQSTYDNPAAYSKGFVHVLVNGTPVVSNGKLDESALPGQPIRGAVRD
ncbi:MAG: amidohydrolase family protein, partial [Bryobacterales bacterium]|nr:amidohydrolase family protein [Bryobacterales bacterium]